jgi:hypothetical protein
MGAVYRTLFLALVLPLCAADADHIRKAARNGAQFNEWASRSQRVLHAWLKQADPKTLLLPDRIPGPGTRGAKPGDTRRLYTPHNSGADLYPYLILTADLTDPALLQGRLLQMLRNEVRYTTTSDSVPGELELATGKLGPPSLFGAGEYAKDGLISVTELLGPTPWYYRMVDMVADAMERAPVESRFGLLPASDAELNGDYLQVLPRLYRTTGDPRFLAWGRRIADAYMDEVLPGNHGLPADRWDFAQHSGDAKLRLRDHGNEMIVGLVLQFTLEQKLDSPRAAAWKPKLETMLDRVIASANPDGLLYDEIDTINLKPISKRLSDNWGYVYGAAYTFYQATGITKYRDATRRVLENLPKYRNYDWENGSFDGYADSIESAIYLVNREPVPQAFDWIDSEMKVMGAMQQPDGHIEYWYGEGNFNRTGLLFAYMKSQGCRPTQWVPGLQLGAVRDGSRLYLSLTAPAGWKGAVRFDLARHRHLHNLEQNYVRLNEFPEWFVVDENRLYRVKGPREEVRLGSELAGGIALEPGNWIIEPLEKGK